MSGDASTRGWGPGWPNPDTSKIVKLRLPGFSNANRLRQELAPLVEWLVAETERRGYHIRPEWTWGFDNRPVRGTEDDPDPEPSNHSWGIALDINAPTNGMNYAGAGWAAQHAAGKTDMPKWVVDLWKEYGFYWGGDYPRRQDPMHMEWLRTPADIAPYLARTQPPKGPLMALSDDEQEELLTKTRDLHNAWIGSGRKPAAGAFRALLGKLDRRSSDLVTGKRPVKG